MKTWMNGTSSSASGGPPPSARARWLPRSLCAASLGFALAACGQGGSDAGEKAATLPVNAPTYEDFAARVPRETGTGFYVVDGDTILHSVEELRAFYDEYVAQPEGALTVYTIDDTHIIWGAAQLQDLSYCVSNGFGGNHAVVAQAVAAAAADWQAPTGARFVYHPEFDATCNSANTNVLFDVSPIAGQSYLARSFFPNDARNARTLFIDASSFAQTRYSITGIVRHELGHVLGFRHEHVRPEAGGVCPEDSSWTAATTYDSASVMHYPQCNGTNTGDLVLTQRDIDGAAMVYGHASFVGVIPDLNGCPATAPEVRFNMDEEDSNPATSVSGWVGGTRSDGNLHFVFCRVDGLQFHSLAPSSGSRSNYAVLKLSGSCPNGSVDFSRHFDDEDGNNANGSSGILWPSVMRANTTMRFCLFRGGGAVAAQLPDVGFGYGVFAEGSFGFTQSGGTGVIFSDDEDSNNANGYSADPAWLADATRIVSSGGNTTLRTARRGVVACGDFQCNGIETTSSCPNDCEVCGNGVCRLAENVFSCPADCASCGDGVCSPGEICDSDCSGACTASPSRLGQPIVCP